MRQIFSRRPGVASGYAEQKREQHSHLVLFVLSVVPAVAGFGHEQGDDVTLGEAEQRAVVTRSVREDGLHAGAPVLFQAGRHGAGSGQGPRLS